MYSFVDQYNEIVEKKCKEQSIKNKVKSYRDYLKDNLIYILKAPVFMTLIEFYIKHINY